MSKFTSIQSAIYSVFASSEWISEDIATVPDNYQGKTEVTEYIRINIIYPAGYSLYNNFEGISGIMSIDIFTPFGEGTLRPLEIADTLDSYFSAKTINNTVQFGSSSLTPFGRDRDNASLYRTIYTINYKYFGEN